MRYLTALLLVSFLSPVLAQNDYLDHEADRWADPTKNRYVAECTMTRYSEGQEPLLFYTLKAGDLDYATMLAALRGYGEINNQIIEAWGRLAAGEDETMSRVLSAHGFPQ